MLYGQELNADQILPLTKCHIPEFYTSRKLDYDKNNYFQDMIARLRLDIELGCGNIETEVALLLINMDLPWRGLLYQRFNIFYYLKKHPFSKLVINPYYMDARNKISNQFNENVMWFEFYGDAKEDIT